MKYRNVNESDEDDGGGGGSQRSSTSKLFRSLSFKKGYLLPRSSQKQN
jgi:hypothetical protein